MTAPTPAPLGDVVHPTPIYTDAAIELFFGIQSNMSMWATAMRNVYEQRIAAQAARIEQLEAERNELSVKLQAYDDELAAAQQPMPDEVLRAIHDLVEHTFWFERLPVVQDWLAAQPKQEDDDA